MDSGYQYEPSYAGPDDKKRKRMISNRESARRSRMRKQKLLGDLTGQVKQLQNENNDLAEKINDVANRCAAQEQQNNVLRAQIAVLTDRLRSLNSVLQIVGEVSGLTVEIPEIPDVLIDPWQLPSPMHPVAAYTRMFPH
ncbi:hypothetical protein NMG60_11035101 [Bertholletia excelsa]